ncbi:hypothetical protein BD560DRAFT_391285 [Blakeslea trispora]|nr:hypothetical protein BD560DRAFT_391285 [Blakeslea trispora]
MINVCAMNIDREQQQYHRMSAFYRRFYHSSTGTHSTVDTMSTSSLSTSSSTSSFDHIFSKLLDALIFTSAIAITAYSYLTGSLLVTDTHPQCQHHTHPIEAPLSSPPLIPLSASTAPYTTTTDHSNSPILHHHYHRHHKQQHNYASNRKSFSQEQKECIEDDKRKRTQAWAEQQIVMPVHAKKRTCSTSHHSLEKKLPNTRDHHLKREKKRTQSLPVNKVPKEDEVLLRMEERLKSMIQEGQEALSSPVKY